MESHTFEYALPALCAVRDKWRRTNGKKEPFNESRLIEFMIDIFNCYGVSIFNCRIEPPYYMCSGIWNHPRLTVDMSDVEGGFKTITMGYSKNSISFPTDRVIVPSMSDIDTESFRNFEDTGEYENSDDYLEGIMGDFDFGPAPLTTVTLDNLTGSYRELGRLTTRQAEEYIIYSKHHRADEIIRLNRTGTAVSASALLYDILRDIPLSEENRRVIFVIIISSLIAAAHIADRSKVLKYALIELRDKYSKLDTFQDLLNLMDHIEIEGIYKKDIWNPAAIMRSNPPKYLINALIASVDIDWNITPDNFESLFPWRKPSQDGFTIPHDHTAQIDAILDPVCAEGVTLARAYLLFLTERGTDPFLSGSAPLPSIIGLCAHPWQVATTNILLSVVEHICNPQAHCFRNIRDKDPRFEKWSALLPEETSHVLVVSDTRETNWLRLGSGIYPDYAAAEILDAKLDELCSRVPTIVDIF